MAKDIQDYWRQSWTGTEAIPQDDSAKLYSGDKEIDVMWSGTDVVYAKQKENLIGPVYVCSRCFTYNATNNSVNYTRGDGGDSTAGFLCEKSFNWKDVIISFDVTDFNVQNAGTAYKFYFGNFYGKNQVSIDRVGHYVVKGDIDSVVNPGARVNFDDMSTIGTPSATDYFIAKNFKIEKNIVDTQYSVAPSVVDNRVKIGKHYYHTTQIGNLIWTTENLNEDLGGGTWEGYYNNDPTYGVKGYGKLYTWDAICKANETPSDVLAAILPEGWRVPTKADFDALAGTSGLTSAKIKEKWYQSTPGANDTGFSSIAGGYKENDKTFTSGIGVYQSSTTTSDLVYRFSDADLSRQSGSKATGRSVRLVRDAASSADVIFLDGEST